MTDVTAAHSPFLRLPPVLRCMIYEHVLSTRWGLHHDEFKNQLSTRNAHHAPPDLAVNSGCRLLRNEMQDIALELNKHVFGAFPVDSGRVSSIARFCLFMKRLTQPQCKMARRVQIYDVLGFRGTTSHDVVRRLDGADGVPGLVETRGGLLQIQVETVVALAPHAYSGIRVCLQTSSACVQHVWSIL